MSDYDKLQTLCTKTYKEQAVWFLNCFWEEFAEKEAELLWSYVLKNEELDLENHKQGSGLDEMKAHVFLEKFDETLTVRDMRDKLRSTGAIGQNDRPKLVPLTHYLLYKYKVDWKKLVDERRQGDNKEELEQAERLLAEVQAAFRESEAKAATARAALIEAQNRENAAVSRENDAKAREAEAKASEAEARARENEAKQSEAAARASEADARAREAEAVARENEAREAEAPFKAAQDEVQSALSEVHKQESEYQGKIADCERRSSEGGVVQQNKAKAELAQLKAEDPLPLRKAKITLEAAEKRAAKARAPFEAATKIASDARAVASQAAAVASDAAQKASQDAQKASAARQSAERDAQAASAAREQASQARQAATEAAQASARAKQAADEAVDAAANRLQEAEAYVNEVRSKPGVSFGSLWWIDRELHEQRKYLPTSRGGIAK